MKTLDLLKNLYHNYKPKHLSKTDKVRWLGGMEAYLIELGIIQIGGFPYDYQITKLKFWFISLSIKETYEEFIIRNVREVVNGKTT